MSLKSCEKAETNIYALEIALEGEEFKKAVGNALLDYVQGNKKRDEIKKIITGKDS